MAREHARILTRIWDDPDFCALRGEQQRLYMLLLSRRNMAQCGVLPLQVRKWAKGAKDTTEDDLRRVLEELEAKRYIAVDEDTEEVLVRSFIRNDGVLKVPNVFKAALRSALGLESPKLREVMAGELRRLGRDDADRVADELFPIESERDPEPFANGSGTVDNYPKPVDNRTVRERFANGSERVAGEGGGEGGKEPFVGGSVGSALKREEPPPLHCQKHRNTDDPPPCRGCGKARETREQWLTDRSATQAGGIRGCGLCDADGRRWDPAGKHRGTVGPCDHRPLAAVS